MESVSQLAYQRLLEAGWNPNWPFIMEDLANPRVRRALQADPTLSAGEKRKIMQFAPGNPGYQKALGSNMAQPQLEWFQAAAAGIKKARQKSLRKYEAGYVDLGAHPTSRYRADRRASAGSGEDLAERSRKAVAGVARAQYVSKGKARKRAAKEAGDLRAWEKTEEAQIDQTSGTRSKTRSGNNRRQYSTIFDVLPEQEHRITYDPTSADSKIGGLIHYEKQRIADPVSSVRQKMIELSRQPQTAEVKKQLKEQAQLLRMPLSELRSYVTYGANKALHNAAVDAGVPVKDLHQIMADEGLPVVGDYAEKATTNKAVKELGKALGIDFGALVGKSGVDKASLRGGFATLEPEKAPRPQASATAMRGQAGITRSPTDPATAQLPAEFLSVRGKEILNTSLAINQRAKKTRLSRKLLERVGEMPDEDAAAVLRKYFAAVDEGREIPGVPPELHEALRMHHRNMRDSGFAPGELQAYTDARELRKKLDAPEMQRKFQTIAADESVDAAVREVARKATQGNYSAILGGENPAASRILKWHMDAAQRDIYTNQRPRGPLNTWTTKGVSVASVPPGHAMAGSLTEKNKAAREFLKKVEKAQRAQDAAAQQAAVAAGSIPKDVRGGLQSQMMDEIRMYGSRKEAFESTARYQQRRYGRGFFASDRPEEALEARAVATNPELIQGPETPDISYAGGGRVENKAAYADRLARTIEMDARYTKGRMKKLRGSNPAAIGVSALLGLLSSRLG